MKELSKRKSRRLQNYDYSQNGTYFITFCTKNRREIMGTISVGAAAHGVPFVKLSECGETVKTFIENIPKTNPDVSVPEYVIMPNHIHLVLMIELKDTNGTPKAASPTAE
ncbi:MAG: hypothetical protein LBB65_01800 [Burkholderiales bacterium]|nr:hypothetical protein [Burkholderiales bacterium]